MIFIKYGYYETLELAPLIVSIYVILSLAVGRKYIFRLYIKVSKEVLLVPHPCAQPRGNLSLIKMYILTIYRLQQRIDTGSASTRPTRKQPIQIKLFL